MQPRLRTICELVIALLQQECDGRAVLCLEESCATESMVRAVIMAVRDEALLHFDQFDIDNFDRTF